MYPAALGCAVHGYTIYPPQSFPTVSSLQPKAPKDGRDWESRRRLMLLSVIGHLLCEDCACCADGVAIPLRGHRTTRRQQTTIWPTGVYKFRDGILCMPTHRFYPKIWKNLGTFLNVTVSLSPVLTVRGLLGRVREDFSGMTFCR